MNSDYSFDKNFRLLSKNDFQNLKVGSRFFASDVLLFFIKKNSFTKSRLGLAVSRKYGKANKRNRFKRLVREFFRTNELKYRGLDILVVPNTKKISKEKIDYSSIEARLVSSLEHAVKSNFKR